MDSEPLNHQISGNRILRQTQYCYVLLCHYVLDVECVSSSAPGCVVYLLYGWYRAVVFLAGVNGWRGIERDAENGSES